MLGLALVLLAGVFFCFQNVIVRVLYTPYELFGLLPTGGYVEATLQSSFLLLLMRMVVGVPLMALTTPVLYRPTWKEIAQLGRRDRWADLRLVLVGGSLMFLYLALLYLAIGLIPVGIALTLFFTFPVFTALFSWLWFGVRPSRFRIGVMGLILIGSALSTPAADPAASVSWLGVLMGVGSGVAYALYTVTAQKSFERFHPFPFTWMSFATTLVLSGILVVLWTGDWSGAAWTALWIGGLLSAIATCVGHLLNNLGIRLIGATTASMLGAVNPALTALLAWVTLQEQISWLQAAGVGLVTLCVALLGRDARPASSPTERPASTPK
ncbi:transporter [filamentous cyanobacterium CCP5]|nr:transporter [filamentous cyanobacterium CCP5]